jgi:8-oxo-dGTP pyrophosphatase MutT (NUDIX family)
VHPAATTLLLRDTAAGLQTLLMQRALELVFHGGAWVFPGGRVEASDLTGEDALGAARRAAVRETYEEAGLVLLADRLVYFSHWTTPPERTRRFATWFFVAQVAPELEVVVDGGEMHAYCWLSPRDALQRHARGELELPPPTFVSLSVLSRCSSADEVLALARTAQPPVFVPRLRQSQTGEVALYHGDVAYDGAPLDQPGPRHRLSRLPNGYCYDQSP